jgi:hypothetical protein
MHSRTIEKNDDSLFFTNNTPKAIRQKRAEIARRLIARSANIKDHTITCMAPSDLKILFDLYNELFFENCLLQDFRGKMKFSLSRRLTSSAGKTICVKNMGRLKPEEVVMEIRMGVDFFFNYDAVESEKKVNGLPCRNALEAFQLVFEHELCHVIEFIYFQTSNCSRSRFKYIARSLFGHLTSYHQLPTRQRIVCEKLGLAIGDPVSFIYGNQRVQGVLSKINKRATVMVRDQKGNYVDREGNRYRKFLVPVELLTG